MWRRAGLLAVCTFVVLVAPALGVNATAPSEVMPLTGQLDASIITGLNGRISFYTSEGYLDITQAVRDGHDFYMRFGPAEGVLVEYDAGGDGVVAAAARATDSGGAQRDVRVQKLAFGLSMLQSLGCEAHCRVFLFTGPAQDTSLRFTGQVNDAPWWLTGPERFSFGPSATEHAFEYELPPGGLRATSIPGVPGTLLRDASISASRDIILVLENATAVIEDWEGGNATTIDATSRTYERRVGGVPMEEGERSRYAILHVDLGLLSSRGGIPAVFGTRPVQYSLDGTTTASHVAGELLFEEHFLHPVGTDEPGLKVPRVFNGESFLLRGNLNLHIESPCADACDGFAWAGGPHMRAVDVRAGAREVHVAGEPWMPFHALGGDGIHRAAKATAAVGLSALGAWALVRRLGTGLALYSRIGRGRILENERRRRIYDHVIAHGPTTVPDLEQATGIRRGVLRYHLRRLEKCGLVDSKQGNPVRWYFATRANPSKEEVRIHDALKDPTRRTIAEVLARATEPPTQRILVNATGLSQRLISYHLGKLREADLLEARGKAPARYVATERLERALRNGSTRGTKN